MRTLKDYLPIFCARIDGCAHLRLGRGAQILSWQGRMALTSTASTTRQLCRGLLTECAGKCRRQSLAPAHSRNKPSRILWADRRSPLISHSRPCRIPVQRPSTRRTARTAGPCRDLQPGSSASIWRSEKVPAKCLLSRNSLIYDVILSTKAERRKE